MNEREFIKLVRELQKLQIKVVNEEYLSIDIALGRTRPTAYVDFYLFIYDTKNNVKELYSKTLYSTFLCSDEVRNNNTIVNSRTLNEIKEKVTAALLLYGGRKRSEAERSDAPIK
jgi:hypothetical protein